MKAPLSAASLLLLLPLSLLAESPVELDTVEVRPEQQGTIPMADTPVPGIYGEGDTLVDVPRSVTLLDQTLMQDMGVVDFSDLDKTSAGTQRPNYLGIAGVPFFRGDDAGVYYEGMRRAYQLLAFPVSFNSVEQQALIKGNAPAHLGVSQAGGLVYQYAKQPFWDGWQGRATATLGSYAFYQGEFDFGGPGQWGEREVAFRLSGLLREAESYYRHVDDDRGSLYGSFGIRWNERSQTVIGAERYRYEGNENLGWNRLDQDLIDHSLYDANAGTVPLDPKSVLVAPQDKAEADNTLAYLDHRLNPDPDRRYRLQLFLEGFDATKYEPGNGFAQEAEQWVYALKLTEARNFDHRWLDNLHWGLSARYVRFDENFWFGDASVRDLSTDSGVDAIGSQGTSTTAGHATELALFAQSEHRLTERARLDLSLRAESHRFDTASTSGSKNIFSGAVAPHYMLNAHTHLYAVVQQGAAVIPSETGAISSEGNFAESELYEVGLKTDHFDGRLFSTLALYYWDTAEFNTRAGIPEKFRSHGLELETRWQEPTGSYLTASFTAQRTHRRGGAPMRLMPAPTFFSPGGDIPANNSDLVAPGVPEVTARLFGVYAIPDTSTRAGLGLRWTDGFYTSYDRFYRAPSAIVWDALLSTRIADYELSLRVDNLFSEDYFPGSDPNFFGNALITRAPGREWHLAITRRF